jgi:putative glutamine amidotransferase
MLKPVIGLTTSRILTPFKLPAFSVNIAYAKSIASAGGLPILIPLNISNDDLGLLLPRVDGILFTGGLDVDPRQYGNPPHPKASGVDADRDRVEIHLVQELIIHGKPFLGICRGCQVINIALGGSLYEDLPEQFASNIQHNCHDLPRNYLAHTVELQSSSRISQILSADFNSVNSLHHQGVNRLGDGLHISALAPDGLVEAFELENFPFGMAVQWHPEELQEHASMRKLFSSFVWACQPDGLELTL